MTRRPLYWPRQGLGDRAYGKQPGLTTREGRNVRNRDPQGDEERRGAQRPGWLRFVDEQFGRPQAFGHTMRPVSLKTWTEWDGTGGAPTQEWEEITPGEVVAYDADVDSQGNLWVLDGSEVLVKYNSAGKRLAEIPLALQSVEELARRVRVDDLDAVYVALSRTTGALAGRIQRWKRIDEGEEEYERAWQVEVDGSVTDFDVRDGELRAVLEYEGDGGIFSKCVAYGNLFGFEPAFEGEWQVPRPANGVTINSKGQALTSSPANPDRGTIPGGEGFTQRGEGWTPHLLPNADQRIYSWLDIDNVWGIADGSPVEEWADRRDLAYEQALGYDRIKDLEPRHMFRQAKDSGGDPFRRPPLFRAHGMALGPALRFDGDADTPGKNVYDGPNDVLVTGVMLQSRHSEASDPKINADDERTKARSILPPFENAKYSLHMVVRLDRRDEPSVLLGQNGKTPFGVVVNGGEQALADPTSAGAAKSGYLGILMGGKDSGGSATITGGTSIKEARWDQYTDASGTFDNESNAVVLSLISNGGNNGDWYLRVNGVAIDKWQVAEDPMAHFGPDDPYTILGAAYRRPVKVKGELWRDLYPTYEWASLFGSVTDIICVLADSSADTSPHDQAVDVPDAASGFSGSIDQTSALADWTTATEVEVIEGWLAGKRGISHVLPNGYANGLKTGAFWHNHPFGGVGNWPIDGAYSGAQVPEDTRNLLSPEPVLAKWSPGGELLWAFTGPGVGYAAAVDEEDDVLTIGEFLDQGVTSAPVLRKILDKGPRYETNSPYTAKLEITAIPADGDYLEFDDDGGGANPTVRFSFWRTGGANDPPPANTATSKWVHGDPNDATALFNLQVAMHAARLAGELEIGTALDYPVLTLFREDTQPAAVVISSGAPFVVTSWSGGDSNGDAWEVYATAAEAPSYPYPRLFVDGAGDLYVPFVTPSRSNHVDKYDGEGNGDGTTTRKWRLSVDLSGISGQIQTYAVVGDPKIPDYGDDDVTGPRYLYVLSDATSSEANYGVVPTLRKYELTSDAPSGATSARDHHTILVEGGNVRRIRRGLPSSLIASSVFSASVRVDVAELDSQLFMFDGFKPRVYLPKDLAVREFSATTGGEVPKDATLAVGWNGRLTVAGIASRPSDVMMSAKGDAYDWDPNRQYSERPPAFFLGDSRIGLVPDVVRGLIPLQDDLLLIPCDHSIRRLTGDPWDGAQLDLVVEGAGMPHGRAWAKDRFGGAYLFDSIGGKVYRVTATGFDAITDAAIEGKLRQVNLATHRPELLWDEYRGGLFLFLIPIAVSSEPIESYFWERREGAWWSDIPSDFTLNPTTSTVLDGDDPQDRIVLIGTEGGRVLYHSDSAVDDDGSAIESSVILGPAMSPDATREARFKGLEVVLAEGRDGCRWEMYSSDSPDALGPRRASGDLRSGRNPRHNRAQARGSNVWVRLVNDLAGESWGFNSAQVGMYMAGRKRVRR